MIARPVTKMREFGNGSGNQSIHSRLSFQLAQDILLVLLEKVSTLGIAGEDILANPSGGRRGHRRGMSAGTPAPFCQDSSGF